MKKILFAASLLVITHVSAQNCFLVRPVNFNTANNPSSVTSADFNGDGQLDLATASGSTSPGSNFVSVLLNTGTGSFSAYTNVVSGTQPIAVISADFNGDGKADLAAVNTVGFDISVLLGTGTGSFGTANHFTAGTKPHAIISDDFNGDGKADIVAVNNTTNSISVLLGTTGTGNFSAATSFTVGTSPQSLISGDFNNDGIKDLAVANVSSSDISVLLGTGTGSFNAPTSYTLGTSPNGIISADFNNDNIKDLATANADSTVTVLLGSGTGSFNTATSFTLGAGPVSLCYGDFNNDGILDISTANFGANNITIILGSGTGSFGSALSVALVATGPKSIISGDFNGDNKADLVTANFNSANVTLAVNNPVVTLSGNATICSGDVATLVANGVKGGTHRYTWSPTTNLTTIAGANDSTAVTSPTITTVYTVTGTAPGGCKGVATVTVTVATPTITVNSPTICAGNTTTLTANGADTYTWSTNETSASITPSPTNTANYTVIGKNVNNCTTAVTATITVNQLPTISVNSATVCLGTVATLTATGADTYTWSTNATTSTLMVTPTTPTSYTVMGTDVNNCTNMAVANVAVNPLPTVTVNSPTICLGNPTTLTAIGATSYVWSTSATTNTILVTPGVASTYTVTGMDVNTCTNIAVSTVSGYANMAPAICMVTSNNISFTNNIINWNKALYANADSFVVYRYDVSNAAYLAIGTVSKDSSQFTDVKQNIGGPNGGDPSLSSWRYKLAVKDTCGNVSAMSPYHETMYIQQINQSITWSAYNVEAGQTNPVTGYQVLRDSLGDGNWHVFVTTLGNSTNDPHYALYPNAIYRVDALGFSCIPNTKSHSNTTKPVTVGINQLLANNSQVSVYPNPSNGNFVIETNTSGKHLMHISDLNGNIILSQMLNGTTTIDASNLNAGVYNISIVGNEIVANKKLVIVK